MVETHAEQPKKKRGWGRLLLKLLLGAGALLMLLLGWFAVVVKQEMNRAAPPAPLKNPTDKLLVKAPDKATTTTTTATTRSSALTEAGTSATLALNNTRAPLRFEPYFPEIPNLSPSLRQKREELNRQYDQILAMVEDYEKNKTRLTPQAAFAQVNAIQQKEEALKEQNQAIWQQLSEAADRWQVAHDQAFRKWHALALIESAERSGHWIAAGKGTMKYTYDSLNAWVVKHWEPGSHMPPSYSPFFNGPGKELVARELYYYRQAGGLKGFAHAGGAVLRRNLFLTAEWIRRTGESWKGQTHQKQ